jgi:hypothetical protein
LIYIVTDSKAIRRRYEAAFEVGKKYGKWDKSDLGFAKKSGAYIVPEFMEDKVLCLLLD